LKRNLLLPALLLTGGLLLSGCNRSYEAANTNANANSNAAVASTRPGPDDSEISTTTDANGVKTETRTFRNNGHISKIVVTTRNGARTTRVYSKNGEEKELSNSESQNVLEETGDHIAGAAGFVADKTVQGAEKGVEVGKTGADKTGDAAKTVGSKTADTAKTVGSKTADVAKTVGEKTSEGAKNVGDKTVSGAKKVGEKTAEGAKKAGSAVKHVIKP
jgi:hypothetical protein